MINFSNDFVAIILTHGRPNNIKTLSTLANCGYTGRVLLAVDDEDETLLDYVKVHGDMVKVFSKEKIGKTFDKGENFGSQKTITYARNAAFEIAKAEGFKYFIQLDDDYTSFQWRFNKGRYLPATPSIKSLDNVWAAMLRFYISVPNCKALAMAQGGDFIGGKDAGNAKKISLLRKAMNSFICSTERPFSFVGHANEDVNTYTTLGSRGALFLSSNNVALGQLATQSNEGGITEFYKKFGTYVKAFQTVVFQPSSVIISTIGNTKETQRIHHKIKWKHTVPKIIREDIKHGQRQIPTT